MRDVQETLYMIIAVVISVLIHLDGEQADNGVRADPFNFLF